MTPERHALARLVAALNAWEANVLVPKVNLERDETVDRELDEAKAGARAVLDAEPRPLVRGEP